MNKTTITMATMTTTMITAITGSSSSISSSKRKKSLHPPPRSFSLFVTISMMILTTTILTPLTLPVVGATTIMNQGGLPYRIANSDTFDTDAMAKEYMYFDVYSLPISTLYSQVHWTSHGNIPLPSWVVDRFHSSNSDGGAGKVMAVVGYEVDQVMNVTTTTVGGEEEEEEVSVPITWAYNHHYTAWIYNQHTTHLVEKKLSKITKDNDDTMLQLQSLAHGNDHIWTVELLPLDVVVNDDDNTTIINTNDYQYYPQRQFFSEGNGGEMRKSYHGYPKGYGQLIQSPTTFTITPMQIDTWDRNAGNSTSNKFIPPGPPLPKSSQIRNGIGGYNPLLECPCSDRLPKFWTMTYAIIRNEQKKKTCNNNDNNDDGSSMFQRLENATECIQAAQHLIPATHVVVTNITTTTNTSTTTTTTKGTCSVSVSQNGTLYIVWNNNGDEKKNNSMDDNDDDYMVTNTVAESRQPQRQQPQRNVVGFAKGIVNITMSIFHDDADDGGIVNMTITGPAVAATADDPWFGIGFGTDSMCLHMEGDECPSGGPYAIIIGKKKKKKENNDDGISISDEKSDDDFMVVEERKLDFHGSGKVLKPSVTILSNSVVINENDGTLQRVVTLSRPLKGPTDDYYNFKENIGGGAAGGDAPSSSSSMKLIMATGCSSKFAQHCGHQSNEISFLPIDTSETICRAGIQGTIGGQPFHKNCAPYPTGDLLHQQNPTCQVETYQGGLSCCRHKHYLLDQNQEIPWPDQPLEYRLKFRFYFEEHTPPLPSASLVVDSSSGPDSTRSQHDESTTTVATTSSQNTRAQQHYHQNLMRLYWTTEAFAGEYDVPQCSPNTPTSQCVHMITSRWKIQDFVNANEDTTAGIHLIYAGPHCHAPVCLSMELYNADTGQLLCGMEPLRGKGGSEKYDEEGFIAVPPCLWSNNDNAEEEGLPVPDLLPLNTTLLSIKRANSTFPHTGEMAIWQMRGVLVPRHDTMTSPLSPMQKAAMETSSHKREQVAQSLLRASVTAQQEDDERGT